MNEATDFKQIKILFWITFVIALGTFFCPFLENKIRWEIYWKIVEIYVLDGRDLTLRYVFIISLIFATLIWQPIMGYAFYRYTVKKRYYTVKQRVVNYFLFLIGSTVYILPIYIISDRYFDLEALGIVEWGYWLLLICMTILFICYLKIQKEQLIDNDLSQHLITDDEK